MRGSLRIFWNWRLSPPFILYLSRKMPYSARPPGLMSRLRRRTRQPAAASARTANRPAGPAPTTATTCTGSSAIGAPVFAHAQAAWVAPAGEKDKKNPLPADAQTIVQGKKVAEVNCVSCHGAKGKGDGAAAVALNPKPADWTSAKVQAESDGEI